MLAEIAAAVTVLLAAHQIAVGRLASRSADHFESLCLADARRRPWAESRNLLLALARSNRLPASSESFRALYGVLTLGLRAPNASQAIRECGRRVFDLASQQGRAHWRAQVQDWPTEMHHLLATMARGSDGAFAPIAHQLLRLIDGARRPRPRSRIHRWSSASRPAGEASPPSSSLWLGSYRFGEGGASQGVATATYAPPSRLSLQLALPPSTLTIRYRARVPQVQPSKRDAGARLVNLLLAAFGIVLTAPVMLLIAAAIRLTSPGPVISRQQRIGLDRRIGSEFVLTRGDRRRVDLGGRPFTMYKFRTIQVPPASKSRKWSDDQLQVTPVGRILRATRLDELPQLFNVLRGEMNVVGPRPEEPAVFSALSQHVEGYRQRQRVLPGITGLAQIDLGYDTDVEGVRRKVQLDLEYIRQRSAIKDLQIMVRSVPVMIFRKVWM